MALLMLTAGVHGAKKSAEVEDMLQRLSLDQLVGQMTQVDISMILTDNKVDKEKVAYWVGRRHIGSILNSPFAGDTSCDEGWTAAEWREVVREVQETAASLGEPPVLFGLDSVHGANYVQGATLFGQQINLAAAFDRDLTREVGRVTARDTLAAGVPWLFSPILGLATQPAWARVFETFGEDPFVAAELGTAIIEGIQSDSEDPDFSRAAACMKHFMAYSHPVNGRDRSPVYLPEPQLRQYYLKPFEAAVRRAGVLTAMESYNEVNGVPAAASSKLLRTILREELGFAGMLVTDWAEILNLKDFHRVAPTKAAAVHLSMNRTSIDMSMVPLEDSFPVHLKELVEGGLVPMSRVVNSVRRILETKAVLGLVDHPVPAASSPLMDAVGGDADLALRSARESVVLLKNEGMLIPDADRVCSGPGPEAATASDGFDVRSLDLSDAPNATACRMRCAMDAQCSVWLFIGDAFPQATWPVCFLKDHRAKVKTGRDVPAHYAAGTCAPPPRRPAPLPLRDGVKNVLLVGPTAASRAFLSGGWTNHWQGACSDHEFGDQGSSLHTALARALGARGDASVNVTYSPGCVIRAPTHATATCDSEPGELARVSALAAKADVIVAAVGEENYTEKPGDIDDLLLHEGQRKLVRTLADAAPNTPIVLVIIGGRPRLLDGLARLPSVGAVVAAFLPGPAGGQALAEVLTGETSPSGRLPLTWPAFALGPMPHWHSVSAQCAGSPSSWRPSDDPGACPVEFPFGTGLSYTTFEYTSLATVPDGPITHPVAREPRHRAPPPPDH